MKNGPISVDTYMKWDRRLGYVGLSRHYPDEAFYEQLATKPRRKQGIAHKFCWQKIIPEALAILRGNKGWGTRGFLVLRDGHEPRFGMPAIDLGSEQGASLAFDVLAEVEDVRADPPPGSKWGGKNHSTM